MIETLKNLFRIKSIITLVLIFGLAFLTFQNPESTEYRTAFISAVSAVMAYYFSKTEAPQVVENFEEKIQK